MLSWYADRITDAHEAALFTGAFGVNEKLAEAFSGKREFVRFLPLEKPPSRKTQGLLGKDRGMQVVYGDVLGQGYQENKKGELTLRRDIPGFKLEEWYLREEHYRKTGNIFFDAAVIVVLLSAAEVRIREIEADKDDVFKPFTSLRRASARRGRAR
jgi:hypothetical protein